MFHGEIHERFGLDRTSQAAEFSVDLLKIEVARIGRLWR